MSSRVEVWWTPERLEQLEALWADGTLSAAKIGTEMGTTKNAVVSAVHRYELPPRRITVVKKVPRREALFDLTPSACRWPHGHPGEDSFHFCGAKTLNEKPYCSTHYAEAHIKERTPVRQSK